MKEQSALDDVSTASVHEAGGAGPAPRGVPALTVISHPRAHRAGEQLLLEPLLHGREVSLSRGAPLFTRAGSALGLPLADPFVSRKPLRFLPGARGGVRLVAEEGGTRVLVDGLPGERWDFEPEALESGVPLVLGARLVLLLHTAEPGEADAGDDLGLVGRSAAVRRVRRRVLQVADLDVPVLIRGETGTGKELVAQALHQRSRRRQGPFLSVNLATVPPELAAAELFGVERGAYTGATRDREGFFRAARGGTLFLDEVGEASPEVQGMLLRVLETGEMFPVGASRPVPTDVRLVAATDAPLEEHIREGRFRAPLLHRLAGYEIRLPPLRERPEDIGLLFFHFARPELEALGEATRLLPEDPLAEPWLSPALVLLLLRHPWPGNVRQLRNVARQVVISSRGQPRTQMDPRVLRELGLAPPSSRPRKASGDARRKPADVTEQELVEALRACAWDLKATAARLGITRGSLYNLIDRSSRIRTVKDVGPEEIIQCFQACEGNLDEMVQRLEVSRSALQRRVKELGLSARRR